MPAALVTEDLAKAFGANVAVGGLSLVVPQGSCFGPVPYTHLTLPTIYPV